MEKPTKQIGIMSAVVIGAACILIGLYFGNSWGQNQEFQKGYVPNPQATEAFVASLGKFRTLKTGAPDLFGDDLPKEVLGWKALEEAYRRTKGKEYLIENQTIGDCVSHGTARAVSCGLAVDFINGERTKWLPVASEAVYAGRAEIGRGSMSDGWYGSAAAKWIKEHGVLFREKYTGPNGEIVDLSTYDGTGRAKQWGYYGLGGKSGKHWLEAEAAKYKVKEVALVTTTGELKAAIANGYFSFICSGVGFEPTPTMRDENGVAKRRGSWAHCMSVLGFYTLDNGELIFVIFNSWGNRGSAGPGGPNNIPTGAFGCRERDMAVILAARDSFVCSGPAGFERRDIDHETWAIISPNGRNHVVKANDPRRNDKMVTASEFLALSP